MASNLEDKLKRRMEARTGVHEALGIDPEERARARETLEKSETATDYGQIADLISQGLVKFGAAKSGAGQIETKGYDWGAARKRAQDKYKTSLADIGGREKEAEGLAKEISAEDKAKDKDYISNSGKVLKGTTTEIIWDRKEGVYRHPDTNVILSSEEYEDKPKTERPKEETWNISSAKIPDQYVEGEDGIGVPVYREVTYSRKNPSQKRIRLTLADGTEVTKKDVKTKVGIDAKSILTDKEATKLATAEKAKQLLDIIEVEKEGMDTGMIANAWNFLGQKGGFADPGFTKFKATVNNQLNTYIKDMTGAQLTEQEAARLLDAMPTTNMDDEEFKAKLSAVKRDLKIANETYRMGLRSRGKNLGEFSPADEEAPPDAKIEAVIKKVMATGKTRAEAIEEGISKNRIPKGYK